MAEPRTTEPSQQQQPDKRWTGHDLAALGMVCGFCGVITCGLSALLGLILSWCALERTRHLSAFHKDRNLAIAAVIVSAVVTCMMFMGLLIFFKSEIKDLVETLGG
jgi:hypothetical protein